MNANLLNAETEDTFGLLLELAANDDLQAFKTHVDRDPSLADEVGPWYGRQKGSSQMALHHLTPLMVAATYGSLDVLQLITSFSELVDVNRNCGVDKSTALHCAASGGSPNAIAAAKILLTAGADPNLTDANGRRPIDVIFVSPNSPSVKYTLQMLLATDNNNNNHNNSDSSSNSNSNSPPLSPSHENEKEYPSDPSLPDIKNSIYSTDEFRMFSFKVRPCSRAYSHDWTECPFVHPGENARRRDPRKYHYSCVPCPDFRKGVCRRGDMCEYAHGVFECWLHPAQYRTRLCKDGTGCNRRVCFFAHTNDELRPLYVSTGSAVPSPRLGSPSFTPPMSPSAASNGCWAPPPALLLPGSNTNLQSSRLRSSLSARDIEHANYFHPKTLTPSNLDDIFSAEGSSPRFSDFSPTIHSNQFLSPIKTSFSPRKIEHAMMQGSFGVMSPRNADPISPMSARMSMLGHQHERFRSLSSRDLGSSVASLDEAGWSKWGPPNGPAEWAVTGDELGRLRRSSSFEVLNDGEEPDLSWVQSLVKESPQDLKEKRSGARLGGDAGDGTADGEGLDLGNQIEDQSVLGAWLEQMQLDQLMAQ
ncbi:zinc finger CCCH domain-containing protein 30 [Phtheirospermum japonicum]|uniref:Zinc finger CCCH domain-containing protein 30 n=1 Tax=Phtheirospermum japonicum TaxID=374723 RepID=A0A830BPV1_9LAMI|nr:zinc finger CCCH domain-containing protein 30 [Phtheirospermum japonicum]